MMPVMRLIAMAGMGTEGGHMARKYSGVGGGDWLWDRLKFALIVIVLYILAVNNADALNAGASAFWQRFRFPPSVTMFVSGSYQPMQQAVQAQPTQPVQQQPIQQPLLLPVPVQAESAAAVASGRTYTVQAGDTIISIARTQLGDERRWHEICSINNIDCSRITPGQVIQLP